MSPADVLRKAAEYIEEHGWIQGGFGTWGGPRCMLGACLSAAQGADVEKTIGYMNALRPYFGDENIAEWNDAPGRTAEEVIAKLREVADSLEAGQ